MAKVPHPTTLMKLTARCGEAAVAGLNEALLARAAEAKLLRTARLRADTTVVPANVAYPTDSGLLARAIRRIAATGPLVQVAWGAPPQGARPAPAAGRRRPPPGGPPGGQAAPRACPARPQGPPPEGRWGSATGRGPWKPRTGPPPPPPWSGATLPMPRSWHPPSA